MKTCTKCKITQELSEFNKSSRNKSGLRAECRDCQKLKSKAYLSSQDVKDRMKENSKRHYRENRETTIERHAKWFLDNPEKMKEYQKKYRGTDLHKETVKNYYYKNRESLLKDKRCRSKNYLETKEGKLANAKKGRKRDDLIKMSSDNTIDTKYLRLLLEKQGYKCNNCRIDISKNKNIDHHIPLSKGGAHSVHNVIYLCPTCNLTKGNTAPTESLSIRILD